MTAGLAAAGIIAGSAFAATSWLTGAPAPSSVKSDFSSYPAQLGSSPDSGSAVLVASDGANQLYATPNGAGSYCVLLTTATSPAPDSMGGGDCVPGATADQAIVAGVFPVGSDTLALVGRVAVNGAASIKATLPDGTPMTAPLGSSGFFVATFDSKPCQNGGWSPQFVALNSTGAAIANSTIAVEETLSSAPAGCWLAPLTSAEAPSVRIG